MQGRCIGTALLQTAEEDARSRGALGFAARGMVLPFFMRGAWFRKHGYQKADRDGIALLLWKPFSSNPAPPHWSKRKRRNETAADRVTVTCLNSGWCPDQNISCERAQHAALEIDDPVDFHLIDTSELTTGPSSRTPPGGPSSSPPWIPSFYWALPYGMRM